MDIHMAFGIKKERVHLNLMIGKLRIEYIYLKIILFKFYSFITRKK